MIRGYIRVRKSEFGGDEPRAYHSGERRTERVVDEQSSIPQSVRNRWVSDQQLLRYTAAVVSEMLLRG